MSRPSPTASRPNGPQGGAGTDEDEAGSIKPAAPHAERAGITTRPAEAARVEITDLPEGTQGLPPRLADGERLVAAGTTFQLKCLEDRSVVLTLRDGERIVIDDGAETRRIESVFRATLETAVMTPEQRALSLPGVRIVSDAAFGARGLGRLPAALLAEAERRRAAGSELSPLLETVEEFLSPAAMTEGFRARGFYNRPVRLRLRFSQDEREAMAALSRD